MLVCANCGKVLKECCDIFFEGTNEETGEELFETLLKEENGNDF